MMHYQSWKKTVGKCVININRRFHPRGQFIQTDIELHTLSQEIQMFYDF
jgi:hypothetical protein